MKPIKENSDILADLIFENPKNYISQFFFNVFKICNYNTSSIKKCKIVLE